MRQFFFLPILQGPPAAAEENAENKRKTCDFLMHCSNRHDQKSMLRLGIFYIAATLDT